ncbi:reductase [uncultured Limosilactobacillus sp.]|uniref:reductase n=1 Tax=uncultured Limosilactobacillus sp. TaxID=2837629 RepID=UPI0025D28873|nr:reductase [uncultured Limosilactobacillus sp.]
MLVRYHKDYQKIVMGLLSFIPSLNNVKRLHDEIFWSTADDQPIFLWQTPDGGHFIGVVILEVKDDYVLVRRLSFTPSERTGRNIYSLLDAVAARYPDKRVVGTLTNQPLITNWEKELHERQTSHRRPPVSADN